MLLLTSAAIVAMLVPPPAVVARDDVEVAVSRGLAHVERQGVAWMTEHDCMSCHQVPSMLWSHSVARAAGLVADDRELLEWTDWSIAKAVDGADDAATLSQLLFTLAADEASAPDPRLDDLVERLVAKQQPDGRWPAEGQLPEQRRPPEESDAVTTMWSMLALEATAPEHDRLDDIRTKAIAWVDGKDRGTSTEWLALRARVQQRHGDRDAAAARLSDLRAAQNADGGWGWNAGVTSDALATGQVLATLVAAGRPADDPVIARRRRFLLATQRDDGSWPVPSTLSRKDGKSIPTSDDWGTAWAVIALVRAMPDDAAP